MHTKYKKINNILEIYLYNYIHHSSHIVELKDVSSTHRVLHNHNRKVNIKQSKDKFGNWEQWFPQSRFESKIKIILLLIL